MSIFRATAIGIALCGLIGESEASAQSGLPQTPGRDSEIYSTDASARRQVATLRAYMSGIDAWRLVERGYGRELYDLRFVRAGIPSQDDDCLRPSDTVEPLDPDFYGWPDSVTHRYSILADGAAEIYMVEETVLSCEGDVTTVLRHYLARGRRTVVFQQVSFYSVFECSATEVATYFFDDDGAPLEKSYSMLDDDGQPLDVVHCPQQPRFEIGTNYDSILRVRLKGLRAVPG